MNYNLQRFIKAQEHSYLQALSEINNGKKRSHWMWYIFPQLKGLGRTSTADYYGISGIEEAKAYIADPVLGLRLIEITEALLKIKDINADEVFGFPDNLKLKSSMTLFAEVSDNPVFYAVLDKYFSGMPDEITLNKLQR